MSLYLSRVRLSESPSAAALKALIDPDQAGTAMDAHHRLIWGLFADTPDRDRDFLWRNTGKGEFITLSERAPEGNDLFKAPETKTFEPELAAGDRLAFSLRANATRCKSIPDPKAKNGKKQKRVDIVMDRLFHEKEGRADKRQEIAQQEAEAWMAQQGKQFGFDVEALTVTSYAAMALPGAQGRRDRHPKFGILDIDGILQVTDPDAFLAKYRQGFGRAKAFGCGLMLIRRA